MDSKTQDQIWNNLTEDQKNVYRNRYKKCINDAKNEDGYAKGLCQDELIAIVDVFGEDNLLTESTPENNVMNEDYVTFEQAVKLKELGFDWDCNHYYNVDHVLCENINDLFSNYIGNTYYQDHNNDNDWPTICSAPTLAQAQKWLREEKDIHIQSKICFIKFNWYAQLIKGLSYYPKILCATTHFDTYEQALSAGIDEALKLLKEK